MSTSGYSPIMPKMVGMGDNAMNAAVSNVGVSNPMGGLSDQTQGLINQNINPITGAPIKPGFFGQGGMAQIGLGAISTLGSLWNSFQQNKIAKQAIALQERTFETNLANQKKTYNTELEDRIRNRYAGAGVTGNELDNQTQSYVDKNKL